MERYIGVDAHASSCTLAVIGPNGKRLGSHVVETNEGADRCGPIDPRPSAVVPRGRDAGRLVARGALAACGGTRGGGGERESWPHSW